MTEEPPLIRRLRLPHREVVLGLVISVSLISMLFAPLWVITLLMVGMGAWLVGWAARTDSSRLVNQRGLPRLWLFGLGGAGVATNLTTLRFMEQTGSSRAALTISLALLVVALLIGIVRAARRYPG